MDRIIEARVGEHVAAEDAAADNALSQELAESAVEGPKLAFAGEELLYPDEVRGKKGVSGGLICINYLGRYGGTMVDTESGLVRYIAEDRHYVARSAKEQQNRAADPGKLDMGKPRAWDLMVDLWPQIAPAYKDDEAFAEIDSFFRGTPWAPPVAPQLAEQILQIRIHSLVKYPDCNSWKNIAPDRWYNAAARHAIKHLTGAPHDEDSGLPHLWHFRTTRILIAAGSP